MSSTQKLIQKLKNTWPQDIEDVFCRPGLCTIKYHRAAHIESEREETALEPIEIAENDLRIVARLSACIKAALDQIDHRRYPSYVVRVYPANTYDYWHENLTFKKEARVVIKCLGGRIKGKSEWVWFLFV